MNSFESNLNKAISICDGNCIYRDYFYRIYTFTTENISGYLKYFDLKDKKLLTVGSSGDQILNAYFNGAKDITLFDINPYTKYYIYLKIAAILSLDYKEFQEFFFKHGLEEYYNKKMFSKELFDKIKPTLRILDYESYLFFDELFCLYKPKDIREDLFDDDESRNKVINSFNIYLRNEETYNKLKSIIKSINFNYINGDVFEDNINQKFDNIFLSNLATTTTLDKLKELLDKLNNNNLNKNGSILISYLWGIDFNETFYKDDWAEIYKMPIVREKLKEYIIEYQNVKDPISIVHDFDRKKDLVLIYRKNK